MEAIEAVGLLGSTVGQIDRAPTTKALLVSQKATDSKATSSLTRHQVKQRILSGMKQQKYPQGKDIAGVKHIYENIELKWPVQERNIQSMHSELCNDGNDQIDIVVTMLPDLAELVHNVTSTQHDTTYKCIFGAFNEWQIVIWHPYLYHYESTYSLILIFIELCGYLGVAIGRIYCNCETRQAYHLIWTEWFKAIERVTSKSVKFKALHKEGKHAIFMVDGSAPQMQDLGDFLLTQNDPLLGAWGMNNRKFETGGGTSLHIHADWDLGPTNTNLNEQSHQATNRATGVHIPLAEAIDRFHANFNWHRKTAS
ncbi:hypothetical protein BU17DRAFT_89177 [Hysterangium stoloniferum]|nr:hypothetical protein BU17DRAFT_89177 [Hysterangium stoloniferum]